MLRRQDDIARAISDDFGHRSRHETLIAEIFAEAIRDNAVATPLRQINDMSVKYCTEAIKAAQARDEIDKKLDASEAANTLFAAIEGIGLRRAFLRETNTEAAVIQFRALAHRYLEPHR